MNYNRKKPNRWILFFLLLVILSLLWFFIDLKNTESIQVISDVEQSIAEPLPTNLTLTALDQLPNRLAINDADLAMTKSYANVVPKASPIPQKITQPVISPYLPPLPVPTPRPTSENQSSNP